MEAVRMLLAAWLLLIPIALASHQGSSSLGSSLGSSRLVPWPSWLGEWIADVPDESILPEDRRCVADSRLVVDHFRNRTAWAARMLDASSAGPVPGLLNGLTDSLGDFDECLGLGWPHAAAAPVEPQYCLVTMRTEPFRLPSAVGAAAWATAEHVGAFEDVHAMLQGRGQHRAVVPLGRMRLGVCLPASCAPEALSRAARRHLGPLDHPDHPDSASSGGLQWAVEVDDPKYCTRREYVLAGSKTRQILAAAIVLVGVLVLAGTALDPRGAADLSKVAGLHVLSAFSVGRHWAALVQPLERGMIAGLAGYKTVMCVTVVVFHYFLTQEAFSVGANAFATQADGSPPLLLIWIQDCIHSGMVTFFFLSGFLMIRAGHEARPLAPLHRGLRFLPQIAAMTLVQAVVLPDMGSGPLWRWRMEFEREDCRLAWWRTLLYVNNFGPRGPPTCIIQLWSLAVDLQCFAVCQLAMWLWGKVLRRSTNRIQEDGDSSKSSLRGSRSTTQSKGWSKTELYGAFLALSLTLAVRVGMAAYYKWPLALPIDHTYCGHLENAPELFRPYTPMSIYLLPYVLGGVIAILVRPLYRDSEEAKISQTWGNVVFVVAALLMVWRAVVSYEAWRDALDLGPVTDAAVSTLRQVLSCVLAAVHTVLLDPRIARPNVWQRLLGNRLMAALHRLTPLVFLVHMMPIMGSLLSTRGPVAQGIPSLVSASATLVVQSFLLALLIQLAVFGPISSLWNSWTRSKTSPNSVGYTEKSKQQ